MIEAESNLNETIQVINKTAREQFSKIFEEIRENFVKVFHVNRKKARLAMKYQHEH